MASYRGTRSLRSFSPAWADPEILETTLIGRNSLVDRLEELAIDGAGGPNKHQRLIVGVRGSGKTHVLRALHNRLWRNEKLKKRLLIIFLLEDELGVASFLDFVVRLLRAIVRWYPEQEQLKRDLEALYDLPLEMQKDRAVQLLLGGAGDKDAVIFMENLGITFDKSKGFGRQGQQALRDLIQKHPRFMIFASSQALVEGTQDPEAPFYGFFKVIHLWRLTVEEALRFLETMASSTGQEDVVRFLNTPKGRARMRAIYEFTGGNHRLLVTFYEFLTADSLARLSELFIQALDPLKPYYKEQMRGLSAQQQKIVQYLALERRPRSVKDIARGCLAASNTISSQLKDLLEKNFVSRIEQGRESYYEITEALFRICYEADLEQEGAPVRLFVDFLVNLYTAKELQLRWRGFSLLAEELGNQGAVPFADEEQFYAGALAKRDPNLAAQTQFSPGLAVEPKHDLQGLFQEMEQAGAYKEILDLSRYLGEERDAFVLQAEAACRKSLELDSENVGGWTLLFHILLAQGHEKEASRAFDRAVALGADRGNLLNSRGEARRNRGQYELAIADYEEALKTDPGAVWPCFNIVSAMLGSGRIQEALDRLPAAIVADKNSKTPKGGLVMQSLQENCQELFEHAPTKMLTSYLEHALEILEKEGYLEQFEESLPLTVFSLLKDHEAISEERFVRIILAFEETIGKRMSVSVAIRFIQVGIDHFKKQDRKALLRLTREERKTFCEQLGIEHRIGVTS